MHEHIILGTYSDNFEVYMHNRREIIQNTVIMKSSGHFLFL